MTNNEIVNLGVALKSCSNLSGSKFVYAIVKNQVAVDREIELIKKAVEPSAEYNEYDKKRVELAEKYAKKNEDGTPKIENNQYALEDPKGFEAKLKGLQKEYKKIIDDEQKRIDDFLNSENEFKLFMIDKSELPENITVEQLRGINLLIKE